MTYSLGLSFTRFFNKFSHDRQEKKMIRALYKNLNISRAKGAFMVN